MPKLDPTQLAEKDAVDIVRTAVRLKHRIAMRHELNELEHDMLRDFRDALIEGRPYELPVATILEEAADEASA